MDLASRVITSILMRVICRYKIIVTLLICLTKSLGPPSREVSNPGSRGFYDGIGFCRGLFISLSHVLGSRI